MFPTSLTSIYDEAFGICPIKKIFIPKNVSLINTWNPFDRLQELEEIAVDPENQYFASVDGVLYTKNMKTLRHFPAKKNVTEYAIPSGLETISYFSFTYIIFVKHLIFPDTVKSILANAFSNANSIEFMTAIRNYRQKEISIDPMAFDGESINASSLIYVYSS